MGNTYKQQWGGTHPGCMILLLDQSGSMAEPFGLTQAGGGKKKCDMVATILNNFLNELIVTNTIAQPDGTPEVRPRADISVLGYEGKAVHPVLEGALSGKLFVTLPELQMNPIDIEMRKKKDVDDSGNIIEIQQPFPVWVKASTGGGTPMCAALRRARELAAQWAMSNPNNYPPVIINVTDGMSTDGDPIPVARELSQVETSDGRALLFNVHITTLNALPVMYPASEAELPNDQYAKTLFTMSSMIPDTSRAMLEQQIGRTVPPGARGLIFNGDAASIRQMFVFATLHATQQLDPNM
jgi:hypothetical protein